MYNQELNWRISRRNHHTYESEFGNFEEGDSRTEKSNCYEAFSRTVKNHWDYGEEDNYEKCRQGAFRLKRHQVFGNGLIYKRENQKLRKEKRLSLCFQWFVELTWTNGRMPG